MAIEVIRDADSTVVLDDDRLPILVVTWVGPATVKNVERFYAWAGERVKKATATGQLLVMVNDALDAERPAPEARAAFTKHQFPTKVLILSPVVLTNPLVRGAMTAISWVLGDRMKGVTSCSTIEEAFESSFEALAQRGVAIDRAAFAGYRRPPATRAKRAADG
jgi:hypothetical protein